MAGNRTEKPNRSRYSEVLLISIFCISLLLGVLIPIIGQKDESVSENRKLTRIPALSASGFLHGTFQDELEEAIGDQFPLSETLKSAALGGKQQVLKLQTALLQAVYHGAQTNYSIISEGYYHYLEDDHRIVEKPYDLSQPDRQAHLARLAQTFSSLPGIELYIYFINISRSVDFDSPARDETAYHQIIEAFSPVDSDYFSVPDYQTYCTYFYQTDHHWNEAGSYLGYQSIYRLLHKTDEGMISEGKRVNTDAVFQGSYARQTHVYCANETFAFQVFDLPKYTTLISGKRRNYGNISLYEKGKYPSESLANHYANCYGGDFGEIVYDFMTEGRGRLLLVASSYSNPINALIAAGYDRTYVIDPRYYEDSAGKAFDAEAYCRENEIDTVLLLGDVSFFYVDEPVRKEAE